MAIPYAAALPRTAAKLYPGILYSLPHWKLSINPYFSADASMASPFYTQLSFGEIRSVTAVRRLTRVCWPNRWQRPGFATKSVRFEEGAQSGTRSMCVLVMFVFVQRYHAYSTTL